MCVCVQLLISKLEKNKSMKAEDKAQLMQTLNALTNSISKLQEEIKGLSGTRPLNSGIKTKAQVRVHTHRCYTTPSYLSCPIQCRYQRTQFWFCLLE